MKKSILKIYENFINYLQKYWILNSTERGLLVGTYIGKINNKNKLEKYDFEIEKLSAKFNLTRIHDSWLIIDEIEDMKVLRGLTFSNNITQKERLITMPISDNLFKNIQKLIEQSIANKSSFPDDFKIFEKHKKSLKYNMNDIIKYLKENQISYIPFDFITEIEPTFIYTKSSKHYQKNKIQKDEDHLLDNQKILHNIEKKLETYRSRNMVALKNKVLQYTIHKKGIDLSASENKVIHAIQTLMTRTGYYKDYINTSEIVPLVFTPSEYLEYYGVKKHKHKDGKYKYDGKSRKYALQSLLSLTSKQNYIYYERKYWKKNNKNKTEERIEIIEEITPLFKITNLYDIDSKDRDDFYSGKMDKINNLFKIAILPHKILLDQIDTYFIMKPANYLTEITDKYPRISKYTLDFIDLLFDFVSDNTLIKKGRKTFDWIIRRNWRATAKNIRLNDSSYWKQHKWTKCRDIITNSYKIAMEFDYIKDYEIDVPSKTTKLDKIYLNKEKFYQPPTEELM